MSLIAGKSFAFTSLWLLQTLTCRVLPSSDTSFTRANSMRPRGLTLFFPLDTIITSRSLALKPSSFHFPLVKLVPLYASTNASFILCLYSSSCKYFSSRVRFSFQTSLLIVGWRKWFPVKYVWLDLRKQTGRLLAWFCISCRIRSNPWWVNLGNGDPGFRLKVDLRYRFEKNDPRSQLEFLNWALLPAILNWVLGKHFCMLDNVAGSIPALSSFSS